MGKVPRIEGKRNAVVDHDLPPPQQGGAAQAVELVQDGRRRKARPRLPVLDWGIAPVGYFRYNMLCAVDCASPRAGLNRAKSHPTKMPELTLPPKALCGALALTGFLVAGGPVHAADPEVHIVVRSFIPKTHATNADLILPVPGNPGLFMISGPFAFLGSEACFVTDHRDFSDAASASARIATDFILVAGSTPSIKFAPGGPHKAGATVHRTCSSGKVVETKTAGIGGCFIGKPAAADGKVQVVFSCSAGNPFYALGPKIDYGGSLIYDTAAKTVSFKGTVGAFPAFEGCAAHGTKKLVKMFAFPPAPGSSPRALFELGLGLASRGIEV